MSDRSRLADSLWDAIRTQYQSPSHDRWHLDRVLHFANELLAIHGGDEETLTAAVMLHDLGRSNPELRGRASAEESARLAPDVLRRVGFPDSKVGAVVLAISEHDQPELTPTNIEGRILKESDFLAGLGSWGILRIAMWAAETGGGVEQVLDRLSRRMQTRVASLQFSESRRLAWREMLAVDLFNEGLHSEPPLTEYNYPGKYIILEGPSGLGKDTQAEILADRLKASGIDCEQVVEPTERLRRVQTLGDFDLDDPAVKAFLLVADRYQLIRDKVIPALIKGKFVLSVRSFLSTIVYQGSAALNESTIAFVLKFVPSPDLLLMFHAGTEVSMERIMYRARKAAEEGGKAPSVRETPESIDELRRRYEDLR